MHFIRARAARQAGWFLPLEMGLWILKRVCDASSKFWLVLLRNPKLGIHRKTEVSTSPCAESRGYYCCSKVSVAAVARGQGCLRHVTTHLCIKG